jgi:predicted O-linked N-acetylglucosamine transferase (SPINDLY family)
MNDKNLSEQDFSARIGQWLMSGDFAAAEDACRMCIEQNIKFPRLWFYLGVAYDKQQKYDEASVALKKAVTESPEDLEAWMATGAVFSALKLHTEALRAAEKAIELAPHSPLCMANLGAAYESTGNIKRAIDCYRKALQVLPSERISLINLSGIFIRAGQSNIALQHCQHALKHLPDSVEIHNNLAEAYLQLLDFHNALDICDKGLKLDPRHAPMHFKRGLLLSYLQQFTAARSALTWAQALQPDIVDSYYPHLAIAAKKWNAEIKVVPQLIFLNAAYHQQTRCDWRDRDNLVAAIPAFILDEVAGTRPDAMAGIAFQILSLPISSQQRYLLAKRISDVFSNVAWVSGFKPTKNAIQDRTRIRIGYISPDFRQHPVGLLTRQIYELHNRNEFEVYAYSLHEPEIANDAVYPSIKANCDSFTDVSEMKFTEIAKLINTDGIDILVDLAGYTTHCRPEVLALRPAPLQVSYLGYPGTMGADFMDYSIVDHIVATQEDEQYWSEHLIRVQNAYCPFDTKTDNSPTNKHRAYYSLPQDAVVFCCFNTNYKIEPVIFGAWMQILKSVPGSILWLVATHPDVPQRLIQIAENSGIDSSRLVFAGVVPHAEHIKRYQLADIFLDTHWHNAHTTAIDALWQGLPVITWAGEVPSSRLASSLLNALEMPELITFNQDDYEKLAVYYGLEHEARKNMQQKLQMNRYTAPLFNVKSTVMSIETAYKTIWQRYQAGLPPARIDVPELDASVLDITNTRNKAMH